MLKKKEERILSSHTLQVSPFTGCYVEACLPLASVDGHSHRDVERYRIVIVEVQDIIQTSHKVGR